MASLRGLVRPRLPRRRGFHCERRKVICPNDRPDYSMRSLVTVAIGGFAVAALLLVTAAEAQQPIPSKLGLQERLGV